MNTKSWGPSGWTFLHTITFNYPEKIDLSNESDRELQYYYKQLFLNFQYTLPCIYCRQSYTAFLKEDPIETHLGSRKDLTYWFYRIHNKVNAKLRKQEMDLFQKRFKDLQTKPLQGGEFFRKKQQLAMEVFFTPADPTYSEVCQKFNGIRASCSKDANKIQSCRI
jgi:hypothetical protein